MARYGSGLGHTQPPPKEGGANGEPQAGGPLGTVEFSRKWDGPTAATVGVADAGSVSPIFLGSLVRLHRQGDRYGCCMKRLLGVVLLAGLLTGCSASATPPPTTHSLAQDQKAVDDAQAAVDQDQQTILRDQQAVFPTQVACQGSTDPSCDPTARASSYAQDEAQLKTDDLKLQVAQDQLKKDEG